MTANRNAVARCSRIGALTIAIALAACNQDEAAEVSDEAVATNAGEEAADAMANVPTAPVYEGVITSSDGMPVKVRFRDMDGQAVIGGDMIVGTTEELKSRLEILRDLEDGDILATSLSKQQKAAAEDLAEKARKAGTSVFATQYRVQMPSIFGWGNVGKPWPTLVIPYVIDESIPAGVRRDNIAKAVEIWNASSPVALKPAADVSAAEVKRLGVLTFRDHPNEDDIFSCSANVGYQSFSSRHDVNLNPSCKPGQIAHEIGHAAGLEHEHQRQDRQAFLAVSDTADAAYDTIRGRHLTGHDLCSIMHYSPLVSRPPWFALTEQGKAALQTCAGALPAACREVGQRCQLSAADVTSLKALYK